MKHSSVPVVGEHTHEPQRWTQRKGNTVESGSKDSKQSRRRLSLCLGESEDFIENVTFEKVSRLGVFQAENMGKGILRNQNPVSLDSPWQGYTEGAVRRGSWMERRWERLCGIKLRRAELGLLSCMQRTQNLSEGQ